MPGVVAWLPGRQRHVRVLDADGAGRVGKRLEPAAVDATAEPRAQFTEPQPHQLLWYTADVDGADGTTGAGRDRQPAERCVSACHRVVIFASCSGDPCVAVARGGCAMRACAGSIAGQLAGLTSLRSIATCSIGFSGTVPAGLLTLSSVTSLVGNPLWMGLASRLGRGCAGWCDRLSLPVALSCAGRGYTCLRRGFGLRAYALVCLNAELICCCIRGAT